MSRRILVAVMSLSIAFAAHADDKPKQKEEARFGGKPTSYWIARLTHHGADEERRALEALWAIGPDAPEAVPALIEAVDDPDEAIRVRAMDVLGRVGPAAKDAVPILVRGAKDKDSHFRRHALFALGRVGVGNKEVIDVLTRAVRDRSHGTCNGFTIRDCGLAALRQIGPAAVKAAFPELLAAINETELESTEPYVERREYFSSKWSRAVVQAIGDIGPEAVEPLLAILKDNNQGGDTMAEAAQQLGKLHGRSKAAIPALVALLDDVQLQDAAWSALGDIGPDAVPALITVVRDWKGDYPPAPQAENDPGFTSARKAPDYATYALLKIGSAGLAELTKLLKAGDVRGRLRAAYALGEGYYAAKPAIPALRAAQADEDAKVRDAAIKAVKKLESLGDIPVPKRPSGL